LSPAQELTRKNHRHKISSDASCSAPPSEGSITGLKFDLSYARTSETDHLLALSTDQLQQTHLTLEVHGELKPVDSRTWATMFPGHPDPPEMIDLMALAGMDGCIHHSILVKNAARPVLLLPVFEMAYDLTTTLDEGPALKAVSWLKRLLPGLVCPKVLGIGFVEGEWGQAGIDPDSEPAVLDTAWQMALQAVNKLAASAKAQIIAFKDFTEASGRYLPVSNLCGFHTVMSLPFAQVELQAKTLDEYLASLKSKMRRYLQNVRKNSTDIDIVRTREAGPWLDQIYRLYIDQVSRSDTSFGVHRRSYFEHACQIVPGAEYVLYFAEGHLIGFELVVDTGKMYVLKYIGMDAERGRAHKLFFVAFLESLRYCMEHRLTRLHIGAAEEELKSRLGATLVPTAVLFRHRNPLINRLFASFTPDLAYRPNPPLPEPHLGAFWEQRS
jgi:uncharacterized protein